MGAANQVVAAGDDASQPHVPHSRQDTLQSSEVAMDI